jgi:hypothetical protein
MNEVKEVKKVKEVKEVKKTKKNNDIRSLKDLKNASFFKMPDKILGIEKELIKLFLVPIGVVVMFLISLGLVVIPKIDEIKVNFNGIEKFRSQIKLNDQKKTYLSSVDQEQLVNDASYLNQAVLKEKKSYLLVGIIRNIADKFNFQVKSFSVSPGTLKDGNNNTKDSEKIKISDEDSATRMPIKVSLVGPSENNLKLIKALENSLPILFIDSFNSKTKNKTSELDLSVSCYYLPDKIDYLSGNLTLNDLRLTAEESNLLMEISEFDSYSDLFGEEEQEDFIEYQRKNPFSL